MRRLKYIFVGIWLLGAAYAGEPPKLKNAFPSFWGTRVPAGEVEIALTFDRPMYAGATGWMGRNSVMPPALEETTLSADEKTFKRRVKLQQGKVYVLALNERGIRGAGFQDLRGNSLPPHYMVFQTEGQPSPQDSPPKVVQTTPAHGAVEVDTQKEPFIEIVFDRAMNPNRHGVILYEDGRTVDIGEYRFTYQKNGTVFLLKYPFRPGKVYEVHLNNSRNIGFSSAYRVPLWPTRFIFTTALNP